MLTLDMYADLVWGWAYLGHRRVHQSLALLGEGVRLRWRPFLIDPSAPRPSVPLEEALADAGVRAELERCTPPGRSGADWRAELREQAQALGIGPGREPRWRANSWGAQRLVTAAGSVAADVEERAVEALLYAHFVRGGDLGSVQVLASIATDLDLPLPRASDDAVTALAYMEPGLDAHDPLERMTREAYLTGQATGVRSSPTFVIADTAVAVGAQPPEVLAKAVESTKAPVAAPSEVRRLRHARALLDARNPLGCLYLLEPLRKYFGSDPGVKLLTAHALVVAGSAGAAHEVSELLERNPDDAHLHALMSSALRRTRDARGAETHRLLARALNADGDQPAVPTYRA